MILWKSNHSVNWNPTSYLVATSSGEISPYPGRNHPYFVYPKCQQNTLQYSLVASYNDMIVYIVRVLCKFMIALHTLHNF